MKANYEDLGGNALSTIRMEQESESKLIEDSIHASRFNPELSLVFGTENLEISGHILFSPITIETKTESIPSSGSF